MLKRYKSEAHEYSIDIIDTQIFGKYYVNIYNQRNIITIDNIGIDRVLTLMEGIGCSKDDLLDMGAAHIDSIEPKVALGV